MSDYTTATGHDAATVQVAHGSDYTTTTGHDAATVQVACAAPVGS